MDVFSSQRVSQISHIVRFSLQRKCDFHQGSLESPVKRLTNSCSTFVFTDSLWHPSKASIKGKKFIYLRHSHAECCPDLQHNITVMQSAALICPLVFNDLWEWHTFGLIPLTGGSNGLHGTVHGFIDNYRHITQC